MKLSQIELFIAVVDNGLNISNAAERVFIAQSALSRQLMLLEDELNHPLFNRKGKRLVSLTLFGELVYKHSIELKVCKTNIADLAKNWSQRESVLTIATTHTQAKYFLPEAILQIKKQLPNLHLRIEQSNPQNVVNLLERQEADIAICTEAIGNNDNLMYEHCYDWRHGVAVPKNHPLIKLDTIDLKQVADYPIVTYVYGFTGRTAIQKGFKSINRKPKIVLSAADTDVIKTYVKIGFGIGIIAKMAFEESDKELLEFRDLDSSIISLSTGIAWLKKKYFSDTHRQAIEIITEFGKNFIAV